MNLALHPRAARWPLPALFAWGCGWAVSMALGHGGLDAGWQLVAGSAASAAAALANHGAWRRTIAALGFPVSAGLLLGGAAAWPAWAWPAALAPIALLYPMRAWRDAPFFPTPTAALDGLARVVTPVPARMLDAGCGLGHGLRALRRVWPAAELHGVEWSAPMSWFTALRCRDACVRRADMWAHSWADFDLIYLFQRPETMPRAWAKAQREMKPGTWLVSLEFTIPGTAPLATLHEGKARPVHVYRLPSPACNGSTAAAARR